MLFDPLSHYEANLKDEEIQTLQLDLIARTGLGPLSSPSPLSTAAFFQEWNRLKVSERLREALRSLRERLLHSDPEPIAEAPSVASRYGIDLPLTDETYRAMMDEVRRYKWLEAERAGRDIWRERNPHDPDAMAFQEWFRNHFGAWYLSRNRRRKYDLPMAA